MSDHTAASGSIRAQRSLTGTLAVVFVAASVVGATGCSDDSNESSAASTSSSSSTTASTEEQPKEELVAEFRGSSDTETTQFTVEEGWELRFEIETGNLTVSLLDQAGADLAELVSQEGPGGGSIYPTQTGAFSLRVAATGTWLIRVFSH